MAALTLEVRSRTKQTAFNLRRWDEVVADPELHRIQGRVETDRHGRIIMSPPPAPNHGLLQGNIIFLLKQLLPGGKTVSECPISTRDGVRAADAAWLSPERWGKIGNRACCVEAPEICVEVISPSNSEEEIREKMALYFDAGAQEVWICGNFGKMSFYEPGLKEIKASALCPGFPETV